MDEAIRKADVLIEALPYIRRFHNKIVVIKYGGSVYGQEKLLDNILTDVVFMAQVGMCPILVHGGGKEITDEMARRGKKPAFNRGVRVTDEETLRIAADVLIDKISAALVEKIARLGGKAAAMNGRDNHFLRARKKPVGAAPNDVDLGFVGEVIGVNGQAAFDAWWGETIPVVAPIAVGEDERLYNVNADAAAAAIAKYLGAVKLVFISDVEGILADPDDRKTKYSSLTAYDIERLIADGTITGGMIPKVEALVDAVDAGVRKAHVVSAEVPHALLLEIFTDTGIGTEILRRNGRAAT